MDYRLDLQLNAAREALVDANAELTRLRSDLEKAKEALKPFAAEKPMPLRKRSRSICLAMLKHVVSEQELEWFEALPTGALDELLTTWRNQSTVSLGESAASS
jgi:hypothetical protein